MDIDILVFCSFRYALGRSTYIVKDVVNTIKQAYDEDLLSNNTINCILREINPDAIYGMDMDNELWQELRSHIEESEYLLRGIRDDE